MTHLDNSSLTPGKFKVDKSPYIHHLRWHSLLAKLTFWSFVLFGMILSFFFHSLSSKFSAIRSLPLLSQILQLGRTNLVKRVRSSARVRSRYRISVLIISAASFVGTHVSATLKRHEGGVLGLDYFNDHYDPLLKRARQALLERSGVFIVEGDIESKTTLQTTKALCHFLLLVQGSYVGANSDLYNLKRRSLNRFHPRRCNC